MNTEEKEEVPDFTGRKKKKKQLKGVISDGIFNPLSGDDLGA